MFPTPALDDLCEEYGVEPMPMPRDMPGVSAERVAIGEKQVELAEISVRGMKEIGQPGTPVTWGQIHVEPNGMYMPFQVRGSSGNPGLYERYRRDEPIFFDAIGEHTETVVSGTFELHLPEKVPMSAKRALPEFVEFYQSLIFGIEGGFEDFVFHAIDGELTFGFAPFEIVWDRFKGPGGSTVYGPRKFAWRETATVDKWLVTPRQDALAGVEFAVYVGDACQRYCLPWTGKHITHNKLLLCNLNARGINFEGIAPMRPGLHWRKFKALLSQIAAVAAEVHGVPVSTVRRDPNAKAAPTRGADGKPVEDLKKTISRMRAVKNPCFSVPDGLLYERHGVEGSMPNLMELFAYADRMMLTPFSNEGNVLGLQSSVGSYALGEVKERKSLAAAPYYARRICRELDRLIRLLCIEYIGRLPEYPRWRWRADGLVNNEAWFRDATAFFGKPGEQWPKKARDAGLKKLGLPLDTFDSEDVVTNNGSEEE